MRRLLLPALLAVAALAGCGVDGGAGGALGGGSNKPNATDAAFARAMVAHERRLGTIARLGSRKALREELRRIARETQAENDQRLPVLVDLAAAMRSSGVSRAGANIGEPPPFDARGLRNAVSFDYEFLEQMIRQHEFAMKTAAITRDHGADKRVRALAQSVHDASRRDLEMLKRWLRTWYGRDTLPGTPPAPPPGGGGGGGGGGTSPGPPV